MKNSGCRGFVSERYDVREFFSGVLRENVIHGIHVLFSTPNNHSRRLIWPRKDTEYRNTNALSIYRRTLPDSSSGSPYTFQLISEKRSPTSGLLPPRVEGGPRPFAKRNFTSLELAWSSGLTSLRYRARENVQDFNPVARACHVYWTITLLPISESSGSLGSCHFLTNGHIHSIDRFHGTVND
jgi:hypothetical protein